MNAENDSDLGFDVERHREGLKTMEKMNLEAHSIQPALRARDLVVFRVGSSKFAIGITDDIQSQARREKAKGCVAFESIHQATDSEEARRVRAEVERYFLRHFPGRTLTETQEYHGGASSGGEMHVYVACYAPAA